MLAACQDCSARGSVVSACCNSDAVPVLPIWTHCGLELVGVCHSLYHGACCVMALCLTVSCLWLRHASGCVMPLVASCLWLRRRNMYVVATPLTPIVPPQQCLCQALAKVASITAARQQSSNDTRRRLFAH